MAVVGAGALGQHHARIYSSLAGVQLVGVADLRPERAREVAERFSCTPFPGHRELLGRVDAASVAVPTEQHAPVAVELLRNGIHVLVEKPIARSLDQAEEMIQARDESGCILHVGHSERFNPALQAVRPYIKDPRFFEAHRLGVFVTRSLDVDVVLDLMIHDLDLVLHFVRFPVREIRAVGIPVLTPRIDIANVRLEFENGVVANLTASRVSQEKVRKLRFFQPHDYISIDFHKKEVEVFSLLEGSSGKEILRRTPAVDPEEPLRLEIEEFLRACSGDPAKGCSAEEGRASLALALDILAQIGQRQERLG